MTDGPSSGPYPPPPPPGPTDGGAQPWWKQWWVWVGAAVVLILVVGVIAVVATGNGDGDEPSTPADEASTLTVESSTAPQTTEASPETTEASATTSEAEAPATTESPAATEAPATSEPSADTTEAPSGEYLGVVWESAVDPDRVNATAGRPELIEGPLDARVDMFVTLPGPDESDYCAESLEFAFEAPQEVESCLHVQWRFDVSDEASDTSTMNAIEGVSSEGVQYQPLSSDFVSARPGTVDNQGSAVYPNLGPGARVFVSYSSQVGDDFIFGDWELVVPDSLPPLDWDFE